MDDEQRHAVEDAAEEAAVGRLPAAAMLKARQEQPRRPRPAPRIQYAVAEAPIRIPASAPSAIGISPAITI